MQEILLELRPHIVTLLALIITALTGYLTGKVKQFFDSKVDQDKQQALERYIKMAVEYVEQIGVDMGAEEKFNLAKKKVLAWVQDKGITISEEELEVLIEAFVHGVKLERATWIVPTIEHFQEAGGDL